MHRFAPISLMVMCSACGAESPPTLSPLGPGDGAVDTSSAGDRSHDATAANAVADASAHPEGGADASAEPVPCAERPDPCPLEGTLADALLWGPVLEAKRACDAKFHGACGELRARVDGDGCVLDFWNETNPLPPGYRECVIEQLSAQRYSCAADTVQRSYDSCTLF